jgi:hypothetical protein
MEGSDRDLMYGTIPLFAWSAWGKPQNPQSGQPVSGPRFEPGTSRMRNRSAMDGNCKEGSLGAGCSRNSVRFWGGGKVKSLEQYECGRLILPSYGYFQYLLQYYHFIPLPFDFNTMWEMALTSIIEGAIKWEGFPSFMAGEESERGNSEFG